VAAGFSKERVSEFINLLARTVELKFNYIRICVYNADETALRILQKNQEK
jgi:hypothetical protein